MNKKIHEIPKLLKLIIPFAWFMQGLIIMILGIEFVSRMSKVKEIIMLIAIFFMVIGISVNIAEKILK